MRRNGALNYLHTDHLGSTLAATDSSGNVLNGNQPRYYAYGAERQRSVAGLPTRYTFTGQRWDAGTGLMYYGARYYDSRLGIFIQPDTIVPGPQNPQSLNRYAYSLNNPLRYRDPTGHDWQDVVYTVHEFTGGFLAEWAYVNSAQMAKSLAVQPGESVAATAGRVAADAFGIYQGAEFMAGGAALAGGGLASCATGVLCLGGAAVAVGGLAIAADGAVVVGYAAVNGGANLGNLLSLASANSQGGGGTP